MILRNSIYVLLLASISCQSQQLNEYPPRATVVGTEMTVSDWSFRGDEGTQISSHVWNIRTTIKYDNILEMLPSFYDSLIERYTIAFGELPNPEEPLDVFLFANELQWQQQLEVMLGKDAYQWYKLGRGGVTIDGVAVLYYLDRRGRSRSTLRIAAHEGWHQYAEAVFKACLPTWLDEGIGTWMEGFRIRSGKVQFMPTRNYDRLTSLRKIISADRLTPLQYLLSMHPSELLETNRSSLLGYYAQLWALINFIMESEDGKYRPAMRSMLLDALNGSLTEPSGQGGWLRKLTDDPRLFEQKYKEWVVQFARPGSSWR